MHYPHPIIAREGWPFVALSAALALLVTGFAGFHWAIPLWVLTAFVLQFFRDPPRPVPGGEDSVLSPADGRLIGIESAHDPYLDREALKLSVFMNVFNVHSNRSPVDGEVKQRWYHAGKFVNASLDKASSENERNALWIRTRKGHDVVCVQVAGLIARRILCYVGEGTRLVRGERYGFIRFGSRLDLFLPATTRIKATIGDKVYASATVLAELT
jgi:phosphatidylserine decarboxylase